MKTTLKKANKHIFFAIRAQGLEMENKKRKYHSTLRGTVSGQEQE